MLHERYDKGIMEEIKKIINTKCSCEYYMNANAVTKVIIEIENKECLCKCYMNTVTKKVIMNIENKTIV
jgi:hypothetical protein